MHREDKPFMFEPENPPLPNPSPYKRNNDFCIAAANQYVLVTENPPLLIPPPYKKNQCFCMFVVLSQSFVTENPPLLMSSTYEKTQEFDSGGFIFRFIDSSGLGLL